MPARFTPHQRLMSSGDSEASRSGVTQRDSTRGKRRRILRSPERGPKERLGGLGDIGGFCRRSARVGARLPGFPHASVAGKSISELPEGRTSSAIPLPREGKITVGVNWVSAVKTVVAERASADAEDCS